jgi:hypothetical protein
MDDAVGATVVSDSAALPIPHPGQAQPGAISTWGNFTGPKSLPGNNGNALYFPGNGSIKVEVANTPDLNFLGGSFFIEAWVAPVGAGPNTFCPILDKWDASSNTGYGLYLEGTATGQARVVFRINSSVLTSTTTLPANYDPIAGTGTWTRVTVKVSVGSSNTVTIFINGTPDATYNVPSTNVANSLPLWIGALHTPPSGQLHMEIALDDVKVGI